MSFTSLPVSLFATKRKAIRGLSYFRKNQTGPCTPGHTQARDGCTPVEGSGSPNPSSSKPKSNGSPPSKPSTTSKPLPAGASPKKTAEVRDTVRKLNHVVDTGDGDDYYHPIIPETWNAFTELSPLCPRQGNGEGHCFRDAIQFQKEHPEAKLVVGVLLTENSLKRASTIDTSESYAGMKVATGHPAYVIRHAWNLVDGKIVDNALGQSVIGDSVYYGTEISSEEMDTGRDYVKQKYPTLREYPDWLALEKIVESQTPSKRDTSVPHADADSSDLPNINKMVAHTADLESVHPSVVKTMHDELAKVHQQFPGLTSTINILADHLPKNTPFELRMSGGSPVLVVNKTQLSPGNYEKMNREVVKSQKDGWLASEGGLQGALSHELGHAVDLAPFSLQQTWKDAVFRMRRYLKLHPPTAKDLSEYAVQNSDHRKQEMFAEAFAAWNTKKKPNKWQQGFNEAATGTKETPTDSSLPPSRFQSREKAFPYYRKDHTTGTCKQGERADLTDCVPASGESHPKPTTADKPATGSSSSEHAPAKRKAETNTELIRAERIGKGKDAKVVLANGEPAPAHITPAMVPPAWSWVKVSMNPDADVLVQGKMKNRKGQWVAKTVYHSKYTENNQAANFAKIIEGLGKMSSMAEENQHNRESDNEQTREAADAVWLMQEQGTRPGSESDTKGYEELYGKPITPENVSVKKKEKVVSRGPRKGEKDVTYSVSLKIDDKVVPIRDEGTKKELLERLTKGENLEDSTYWLKSHGATTLEGRHVVKKDDGVHLRFVGKEGVYHDHLIRDPKLADMLMTRKQKTDEKGQLFQIDYSNVVKYVATLDGGGFTPKNLRTMRATKTAIDLMNKRKGDPPKNPEEYQTAVMEIATQVSKLLGNRPLQALESYIAPEIWAKWKITEEDTAPKQKSLRRFTKSDSGPCTPGHTQARDGCTPRTSLAGDKGEVLQEPGGYIDVMHETKYSPRKQGVIDFVVEEAKRGQGIGDRLLKRALEKYPDLGGQVSSPASLKVFYNNGFRNPDMPSTASFEDTLKMFKEDGGSLYMAHKDDDGNPYVGDANAPPATVANHAPALSKSSIPIMEKYKDEQASHEPIKEFMEANGLTLEDYKKINELYYSHNISSGGENDQQIVDTWHSDSPEGKAMRAFSAWNEWQAENGDHMRADASDVDWEAVERRIDRAEQRDQSWESAREHFYQGSVTSSPDDYRKLLKSQQEGKLIFYRKGPLDAEVVSTTLSPKGAKSGSSHFVPDTWMTLDSMKQQGYHLLAGVRGMIGVTASQERECIWIKPH